MVFFKKLNLYIFIFMAFFFGGVEAKNKVVEKGLVAVPFVLPGAETFLVKAKSNKINYRINVQFPLAYEHQKDKRYPVMYVLDANMHFPFQINDDAIVVGIEWDQPSLFEMVQKEKTALSSGFSRMESFLPQPLSEGDCRLIGDRACQLFRSHAGQAKAFKAFVVNELKPLIEKRYRTTKKSILWGHSMAGYFATWVLVNQPDAFDDYVILSPALFYGDFGLLKQAKEIPFLPLDQKHKVYLGVGAREVEMCGQLPSCINVIEPILRLYEVLAQYPFLEVKKDIIENEGHMKMIPSATNRAKDFIFGPEKPF
jgi:predicted alpha/beta superfamily hydrolase